LAQSVNNLKPNDLGSDTPARVVARPDGEARESVIMSVTQLSMDHTSVQAYSRPVTPLLLCLRGTTRMSVPWPKEFPTELVFEVFKYLPQADLARACLVSRYCNIQEKAGSNNRVQRCFGFLAMDGFGFIESSDRMSNKTSKDPSHTTEIGSLPYHGWSSRYSQTDSPGDSGPGITITASHITLFVQRSGSHRRHPHRPVRSLRRIVKTCRFIVLSSHWLGRNHLTRHSPSQSPHSQRLSHISQRRRSVDAAQSPSAHGSLPRGVLQSLPHFNVSIPTEWSTATSFPSESLLFIHRSGRMVGTYQ